MCDSCKKTWYSTACTLSGEPPSEEKKEIDDNDYEAQDAETMRQRNWDEFVEANPKGWGK